MPFSRRDLISTTSLALLTAATAEPMQAPAPAPPGTPPAFGTGNPAGPPVTAATFAEAEKLVQIQMTPKDRTQAASNWRVSMAPLPEFRTGPRKTELESTLAPYSRCDPSFAYRSVGPKANVFVRSEFAIPSLPSKDEDIAFAPVSHLSRWIETRRITSERLT